MWSRFIILVVCVSQLLVPTCHGTRILLRHRRSLEREVEGSNVPAKESTVLMHTNETSGELPKDFENEIATSEKDCKDFMEFDYNPLNDSLFFNGRIPSLFHSHPHTRFANNPALTNFEDMFHRMLQQASQMFSRLPGMEDGGPFQMHNHNYPENYNGTTEEIVTIGGQQFRKKQHIINKAIDGSKISIMSTTYEPVKPEGSSNNTTNSETENATVRDDLTDGKIWIKSIVGSPFIIYGLYKIYVDFTGGNKPIIVNYMEFEPVPLPESDEEIRLLENKRVILRGHFDHSSEILVGPCQNLNAKKVDFMGEVWPIGYHLFTPFTLSDSGRRILVNRGYVSNLLKDPSRRMLGQVEDEITFNAIVELQSNINTVQRLVSHSLKNDWIYDNVFKRIDMELFSRKLNIDPIAIFVADKESTLRNGPIGGQIQSSYDSELLSAAFPVVS